MKRILIADDDPVSRRLLEGTLVRLGHEVVAVADGREAIDALLQPDAPTMAILDWMMPGADGLEVCRAVRAGSKSYVYLILLTARDRREDMLAGLDAEADDFLTKPLQVVELRARLRSGERVIRLQEDLLRVQAQLRIEATHDRLTGLVNRGEILDQLDNEMHRSRREGRPIAIAIADLDHFKSVNDTHGHAAGDTLLRQSAARMKSVLRPYDVIGRYGGEEFLLILPGCDGPSAKIIANRARQAVSSEPMRLNEIEVPASVSLGVAATHAGIADAAALIQAADEALYRAKHLGRNRVEE